MKLSIVVGMLNQFELTGATMKSMVENLERPEETEFVLINNGSERGVEFLMQAEYMGKLGAMKLVNNEKNLGNYPLFKQGLRESSGEVIAFLHSDVFVYQKGWDVAVRAQFDSHDNLGVLGFIGSTELDNWAGRGSGTTSNMQGRTVDRWHGSAGHHHGAVSGGMTIDGSVVDGCVMIFRREVLDRIEEKKNMPPHHFYDRLMCVQAIELGYKVGILGIEFDHVSGQVANQEQGWQTTSKEWFEKNLGISNPMDWGELRHAWVNDGRNPSRGKIPDQWDYCAYLEAEYQFLAEYRDQKRLVPLRYGKRI